MKIIICVKKCSYYNYLFKISFKALPTDVVHGRSHSLDFYKEPSS